MTEKIQAAKALAQRAHSNQVRKGTDLPYFIHVHNVGQLLMKQGYPEHVVIAGLLHDVLEDTDFGKEAISDAFGQEVLRLVMAASETAKIETDSTEESLSWRSRKQHTLDFLEQTDEEAVLAVTCADKLDNISAIHQDFIALGEKLWNRFNADKTQQAWYYSSLAKLFIGKAKSQSPAFQAMAEAFMEKVRLVFGDFTN